MVFVFCLDKKDIDLVELSQYLQTKLGIKLHSDTGIDVVNGDITGNHFPVGEKIGEDWAGCDLTQIPDEHSCLVISLYEIDEVADNSHKTNFVKKVVNKNQLHVHCQGFAKSKNIKYKRDKPERDNQIHRFMDKKVVV